MQDNQNFKIKRSGSAYLIYPSSTKAKIILAATLLLNLAIASIAVVLKRAGDLEGKRFAIALIISMIPVIAFTLWSLYEIRQNKD